VSWIILGFALLASAFTANKFLLYELSPVFFVGLRMLIAGVLLCGFYLWRRSPNMRLAHLKKDAGALLTICFSTTFVPSVFKAFALKYLMSSEAVLIGSLDPFITAIYAYLLFNEKITYRKLLGVCIGFFAITLLISTRHTAYGDIFDLSKLFTWPVLAALGAVVIGRYGWILTQSLLQRSRYEPAELNGISMLGSGCFALITSFATGSAAPLSIWASPQMLFLITYTVVIGNLIAYTMYANFLKKYPVTLVSFLGFSVPIFSHFYGWMVLEEPLSWKFFLATSIAALGLVIYSREKSKETKVET